MDPQYLQNGQNAKKIICKVCSTDILLPAHGTHVTQPISLPTGKDGETTDALTNFWHVKDIFDFQNIGFLRTVQSSNTQVKYLTCASCERGVLGVQQVDNQNKIFLSHDRVTYKQ